MDVNSISLRAECCLPDQLLDDSKGEVENPREAKNPPKYAAEDATDRSKLLRAPAPHIGALGYFVGEDTHLQQNPYSCKTTNMAVLHELGLRETSRCNFSSAYADVCEFYEV